MEERELIQVNLRFPAAALEGLSRLADSLRALAEAAGGGAPPLLPMPSKALLNLCKFPNGSAPISTSWLMLPFKLTVNLEKNESKETLIDRKSVV